MYKLYYSPLSQDDLNKIWEYISKGLENPGAARRIVNEILAAIMRLNKFPEMGARLSSIAKIGSDYRFLVIGNYLAFYRFTDDGVYIDRILYGRRDYMKILFGDGLQDKEQDE